MPSRLIAIARLLRTAMETDQRWLNDVARDMETLVILERELRAALEAAEADFQAAQLKIMRLTDELERERAVSRYYADRVLNGEKNG
jgi:hypothetical protein